MVQKVPNEPLFGSFWMQVPAVEVAVGEGVRKPVFHPSDVGEAAAYRNPRHLMGGRTL